MILVIDDQEVVCETIAMVLRSQKYIVYTANNGFDALAQLRDAPVDLVISDLSMPGMSGFEVISAIGARYPMMPVVAMSGAYGADRVPRSVAFYAKGQGPEKLLSIVEQVLSQDRDSRERAVRNVKERASGAEEP